MNYALKKILKVFIVFKKNFAFICAFARKTVSSTALSWAFRLRLQLRRRAFRSIFAPLRSAKDAAAIPNALEAPELRLLTKKVETHQRHIVY